LKVLEKFLSEALSGSQRLVPNSEPELGIATVSDDGPAPSVPTTASRPPLPPSLIPFVTPSAEDASRQVGDAQFFAVLDEQSSRNDTAILVARQEDDAIQTVRVTFDSAQHLLTALDIATLGFEEIRNIADSSGGVYGTPAPGGPQKGGAAPRKRLGT
jgi:hypothetical protein